MEKPAVRSVLVVEDLPPHAQLIQEAIREIAPGCKVDVVGDVEQALTYLGQKGPTRPDLVVLDVFLPGRSGLDVLEEIRQDAHLSAMPVLVLTCSDRESDYDRAYSLRANSCVRKPDNFSDLRDTVASSLKFWFDVAMRPGARPYGGSPPMPGPDDPRVV